MQTKIVGSMPEQVKHAVIKSKKRSIGPATLEPPTYNVGQQVGPPNVRSVDAETTKEIQDAKTKDLIWFLARMSYPEIQTICSWPGFNIQIRDEVTVVQDTISCLPTINAPATKISTVNEALNQTLSIIESLQLDKIVCVFDQALYAKAAEIVWKHDKFKNIIIRMGSFHTICNLYSIIGKRFQDAGLWVLCVESGVIDKGSVAGVMDGCKYNCKTTQICI